MGVKVRKRNGKWYVVIDYHGRRKSKCIGTREAAERVKREVESRLALGEVGILDERKKQTFGEYAQRWLSSYVAAQCKPSTAEGYGVIVRVHLIPRFGEMPLERVSRGEIKSYLSELVAGGKFARATIQNILATLRAILMHAVEDGLIAANPALRLGRFNRPQREPRKREFLTREEAERFLDTAKKFCPERFPLFLTALRTGMREGELLALEWDDIQFGTSENDPNRYILVRRNFTRGQFTTPKNRKERRIDLSRELRRVLMELRDQKILKAFERGEAEIPKLVFPSATGGPLDGRNVYHRDFRPCLEAAGLRAITFHSLRHTFASLLIQGGASLPYVREQMGHSSISVTVDIYGHLLPGGNLGWIDGLDSGTEPHQSATYTQPTQDREEELPLELIEKIGRRGGTRTPDPRIRNPMLYPAELHARAAAFNRSAKEIVAGIRPF